MYIFNEAESTENAAAHAAFSFFFPFSCLYAIMNYY